MKLKKADIGKYVSIRFLDHVIVTKTDVDEPMEIECVGRVEKVTKKTVVLHSWTPITADAQMRQDNSERTVLLQSAIIKVYDLQPVERIEKKEEE